MTDLLSPLRPKDDEVTMFSQVPGNPSFRNHSVNAVAMVPLMISHPSTDNFYTERSFNLLFQSLQRYSDAQVGSGKKLPKDIEDLDDESLEDVDVDEETVQEISDVLLVIPSSQLTRPGDWRYEKTPLKNFHWGHGCQRMICFDGRAHHSRRAHDRLLNHTVTREWIDLCPSRRTAAVVGILNLKDIEGLPDGLRRAEAELQRWAERYSTPSYEVTTHGRSFARDGVVQRLFVFDSSNDGDQVDLSSSRLGTNLVAFPSSGDKTRSHTMDLHLNVVLNDLAVAIFRQLEIRIRESDSMAKEKSGWLNFGSPVAQTAARAMGRGPSTAPPQLLTPLDTVWDLSEVSSKDADALRRRDVGRREKLAADLSLLAGSPMDAYERYSKAAELAKQSPDPLWYAAALEGCAAAHMSMAETGGYNVDSYLESNFQLPEEFMAVAQNSAAETKKTSHPKQTLPTVVYALCEEALQIYSRHAALANFRAELLLKMASYAATVEESHLRCRWGEGPGCYGGEPSEPRRWDRTSVARLTFGNFMTKDGEDLFAVNTMQRIQRFSDFLHRAVSTGLLDPLTRSDIAASCARLCLEGLQSTRWKFNDGYVARFPRKAAFFTTIAAEALSKYTAKDSVDFQGSSLWLAASQLYDRKGNTVEGEAMKYGWSTLRATVLHALSQQEDPLISEAAAELLLMLMSEMSSKKINVSPSTLLDQRLKDDDSFYTRTTVDDDLESVSSMSSRRSTMTKYTANPKPNINAKAIQNANRNTGFFLSSGAQQTILCVAQAKWADDKPIPPIKLPLIEEVSPWSLSNSVVALKAVISKIDHENCAAAQQRCINQITELRKEAPKLSTMNHSVNPLASFFNSDMAPLRIESAKIVKAESHLLLERIKAHGFSGKSTGVMATFFNPFDNKKKLAEKKVAASLVAEGEERQVEVELSNRLSIEIEIPSCQLVFNKNDSGRIKSPALSFSIPSKASKFKVHFPFFVIRKGEKSNESPEEDVVDTSLYEVVAIRLTCLSRSYLIPVNYEIKDVKDELIPIPASVYTLSKHSKESKKEEVKPRFEVVPAQPNLQVSFTTSQNPIEDGTTVPVHLSDGEIFTIPPFRLQNDFGPSGLGLMERLQIIGVGMPGIPDEMLFDTDANAAALENEDDNDDSAEEEEDEFEQLMEEDGLPPLKMKALCESLSIKSINDKSTGEGSRVTFQVAATHDMGNQLANGGNVRIRFRYRGISPNPATEIWRKREIALRIIRVRGPRISSLTFRSDLSWGSSYSELCLSLAKQKAKSDAISGKWGSRQLFNPAISSKIFPLEVNESDKKSKSTDFSLLTRVGMDPGVHVASDEIVVLMAVANETNSTILLSNRKGRVGGFSDSPMPTVRVTSGVSVKIPVVIPRIDRTNSEDPAIPVDIAADLVTNTALTWTSVVDSSSSSSDDSGRDNAKIRQGRVRIPSKCLREIISEHACFASRICAAPVRVWVELDQAAVPRGNPVTVKVMTEWSDWVPADIRLRLSRTLEFACARKPSTNSTDFVWCGRIRRTVEPNDPTETPHHVARIVFLTAGSFVVSACVHLSAVIGVEETWWAPLAEQVVVT